MAQGSDNGAVVDNSVNRKLELIFVLGRVDLSILGEALLLRFVPILIKSSLDLFT